MLLSTPFGKRGFFYDAWTARDGWDRYEISARECPRISDVFLEEEERTLGEWWFKQEYLCEFQDGQTQAFRTEDVMSAINPGLETWKL